jgi:hypothetical protein
MFEVNQILNKGRFDVRTAIRRMALMPNTTLQAEEAERFIDGVWDQSVMKDNLRLVKMKSEKKKIHQLGLTTRILYPEATFDNSSILTAMNDTEVELDTEELRAGLLIKDADLEDMNIGSPQAFKNKVMELVQKKLANELSELYWIADENDLSGFGATDARSVLDGIRYQLDHSQTGETYVNSVTGSTVLLDASNTVTAKADDFLLSTTDGIVEFDSSAPYHPEFKFDLMMTHLPNEYWSYGPDNFRLFLNPRIFRRYQMGQRRVLTELGDSAIVGGGADQFAGAKFVQCPQMSLTMEVNASDAQKENHDATNGTLTDVMLTWRDNIAIGIQLNLVMETERSARDRGTYFYWTIRTDVKVMDVHGVVLLKRLADA